MECEKPLSAVHRPHTVNAVLLMITAFIFGILLSTPNPIRPTVFAIPRADINITVVSFSIPYCSARALKKIQNG